jgi:hypothetical protein
MKNILLAGVAGLLLAFAAAGATADTIYHADGTVEYAPGDPAYVAPAPLVEGRSAYVEDAPITHPRYYHRRYYERAPFPFSALPWNW